MAMLNNQRVYIYIYWYRYVSTFDQIWGCFSNTSRSLNSPGWNAAIFGWTNPPRGCLFWNDRLADHIPWPIKKKLWHKWNIWFNDVIMGFYICNITLHDIQCFLPVVLKKHHNIAANTSVYHSVAFTAGEFHKFDVLRVAKTSEKCHDLMIRNLMIHRNHGGFQSFQTNSAIQQFFCQNQIRILSQIMWISSHESSWYSLRTGKIHHGYE